MDVTGSAAPDDVMIRLSGVGKTYDDGTVFRAGAALESALGLWSDPTWRPGL